MAPNRWVAHLLLLAGLPTLPACVTSFVNEPGARPSAVLSSSKGTTDFGIYPRAPGERVALHPAESMDVVETATPAVRPPSPEAAQATLPPIAIAPTTDPPLVQIIRAYLDDRPDVAHDHINKLEPANQELMLQLIPAVVRLWQVNLGRAGPHEVALLATQLEEAASELSSKAPLMIEKACFCEEFKSFGHYKPLPERAVFRPGKLVCLYTEIRNVPSEPFADPVEGEGFLTRLVCTLELRDSTGAVIELTDKQLKRVPKVQEPKHDFSRSPLRDYCLLSRLDAPSKPGTYTVTFEVRDPQSGRAVSKPMTFRVQ